MKTSFTLFEESTGDITNKNYIIFMCICIVVSMQIRKLDRLLLLFAGNEYLIKNYKASIENIDVIKCR